MLLDIKNVSKSFSGQSGLFFSKNHCFQALDDVRLGIPDGSFFVLFGPHKSGKTTLLRIIGKEIVPDSGNVFFENEDIFLHSKTQDRLYRQKVCGIFSDSFIGSFFEKNIGIALEKEIHLHFPDKNAIERKASLRHMLDEIGLPFLILEKDYADCTKEERIRLLISRAFLSDARLIIFDDILRDSSMTFQEEIFSFLLQKQDEKPITYLYAVRHIGFLQEICTHSAYMEKGGIVA